MYTVSKAKKGVKYKVLGLDEFWTKKRLERFLRGTEPFPHEADMLRFLRERMEPELEKYRAQRAKQPLLARGWGARFPLHHSTAA